MRVIAGEFRSRKLKSLEGTDVRPTPDRMRETLFNVIGTELPGTVFLDAYAGTGAVGIEALSRGAARAIFIEKNRRAVEVIDSNLRSLGLLGRSRVIGGAVKIYLAVQRADIVFLDPPYNLVDEYADALAILGHGSTPLVIAQHDRRTALPEEAAALKRVREIRQGDNVLSFYRTQLLSGSMMTESPT
jgi:16S rRNA (guanine(966)-N(2))-methyltransferase RsmD